MHQEYCPKLWDPGDLDYQEEGEKGNMGNEDWRTETKLGKEKS